MRGSYVVAGVMICLIGAGIVYYQVSESCEDSTLSGAYKGYPWCTDVLDHINLTFVGVIAFLGGIIVLALGGPLHWLLEPSSDSDGVGTNGNRLPRTNQGAR